MQGLRYFCPVQDSSSGETLPLDLPTVLAETLSDPFPKSSLLNSASSLIFHVGIASQTVCAPNSPGIRFPETKTNKTVFPVDTSEIPNYSGSFEKLKYLTTHKN